MCLLPILVCRCPWIGLIAVAGMGCEGQDAAVWLTGFPVWVTADVAKNSSMGLGSGIETVGCASQGIEWSTGTVYKDTEAKARAAGLQVAPRGTLPVLQDIDHIEVTIRIFSFLSLHLLHPFPISLFSSLPPPRLTFPSFPMLH